MLRRPPRSTRTDTLFPYTTLFRALDLEVGIALVEADDGSTYTVPRSDTQIRVPVAEAERSVGAAQLFIGVAEVSTRVIGYQRKDTMTGAVVASEPLDLPTSTLTTRATWYVIEPELAERAGVDGSVLPAALHAIEHAAIGMLPLFADRKSTRL